MKTFPLILAVLLFKAYNRGLQVHERLTSQIEHLILEGLQAFETGVVIEAVHLCMVMSKTIDYAYQQAKLIYNKLLKYWEKKRR